MTRLAKEPMECKRACVVILISLTDYLIGSDGFPVSWKCCNVAFHKTSGGLFPNYRRPWTKHLGIFYGSSG